MKTARITQLESDIASVLREAQPLAEKSKAGTLTPEENTRFEELVTRSNTIGEELTAARNQANAAAAILERYQEFNVPADQINRNTALDGGSVVANPNAYKSLGQRFVESPEFKERNARGVMADGVKFDGLFPEYHANGPESERALIYSGTGSASMLLPQVVPGIFRPGEAPLNMRDVLLNMSTNSDSITVISESAFTNGAIEVIEATSVSTGAKPESALTFAEVPFPVQWIAHWIPITRQMLEDLPMMSGYVNERLRTGLKRRENYQALNGDGAAPNLRGLLNTSGIQTLDAAYFAGSAVQDAGQDNENVNRLRRAKRVIQVTGKAQATFAVVNPTDLEQYDTITDAQRQYLIGGPLAPAPRRLWGLDIVESEDITAGTVLVGDGTMAAFADRHDARVYTTDSHSDFFIRNIFVILAEERLALPVFRPAAFAKVSLAAWA